VGRDKITRAILDKSRRIVAEFGIELVDVQIRRVNYVAEVQQKVYDRMISERRRPPGPATRQRLHPSGGRPKRPDLLREVPARPLDTHARRHRRFMDIESAASSNDDLHHPLLTPRRGPLNSS
jgi:hypothetical protein